MKNGVSWGNIPEDAILQEIQKFPNATVPEGHWYRGHMGVHTAMQYGQQLNEDVWPFSSQHWTEIMSQKTNIIVLDLRFSQQWLWTLLSSGVLWRVALARTDVLEEWMVLQRASVASYS
jgi:hypothetical protein